MNPRITRLTPAEKEALCRLREMLRRWPPDSDPGTPAPRRPARKPAAETSTRPG